MHALATRAGIEVRFGNVSLAAKLDTLAAALQAVRLAHRDDMSALSWAALNRAEAEIAEATLSLNRGRLLRAPVPSSLAHLAEPEFPADGGQRNATGNQQGGTHAPDHKAGYAPNQTPAEVVVASAGNGVPS